MLIQTVSSNTLQLVNSLLDISAIESGILHLTCQQQDYITFLKEIVKVN
uniref:Uncharacterized protein n=1 Tax=Roseihalotalea indica TaxID=2867963 RepID=A0AA49GMZ2_9BACT|nr:hypothetical protein K4G66_24645 [Tunicatimonas sp. TK19036]